MRLIVFEEPRAQPFPAMVAAVRSAAVAICALLLLACTGTPAPSAPPRPTPGHDTTPTPASTPTTAPIASPTASPTAGPSAAPSATPSLPIVSTDADCTATVDATHNLILATLAGSNSVVLRDITNLAAPQTLCTFSEPIAPRFVSASVVSWAENAGNAPGDVARVELPAGNQTDPASWTSSGFDAGLFDWSPDGSSLTYIGPGSPGPAWHLKTGGTDRVLTTLPAVPGRGVDPHNDDFMLAFSPDGLYVALVQTFATGGSGETAPLQVRKVSDGSLAYSASSGTMA